MLLLTLVSAASVSAARAQAQAPVIPVSAGCPHTAAYLPLAIALTTDGDGAKFKPTFSGNPAYVDTHGDLDFRTLVPGEPVEVTITLTVNTGIAKDFWYKANPSDSNKMYYGLAYAEGLTEDDGLHPIGSAHHQITNIGLPPGVASGAIMFCYLNDTTGGGGAPRSHPYGRYGIYLSDSNHPNAPLLFDPIISNGGDPHYYHRHPRHHRHHHGRR
jgi:hypothetical protein